MRVASPVGEFPFTVRRVRREGRELVIEGELGAWRSTIRMSAADAPMLARALRGPLAVAGIALAGIALVTAKRR